MTKFVNLRDAFPDYDINTLPAIPETWIDASWQHDACPSFCVSDDQDSIQVFVDYAKPEDREMPETTRFVVDLRSGDFVFTDDWSEVLRAVADAASQKE